MTHANILKKFLIEYDKANVTSSYPSLTQEEIATILNKAYLALIAQKVTGNNPRRAPFEADTKAISDIQPLTTSATISKQPQAHSTAINSVCYNIPGNFLYYISGMITLDGVLSPVQLVNHDIALKFKLSRSNRPWIKDAVAYIEDDQIVALYDNYNNAATGNFVMTYVKEPSEFTASMNGTFELNDTMAEELISLAVLMALENVESTRLNAKAQMRGLEA